MVMDRFYFCNGDSVGNLDELLGKLKVIDDDCFEHHVNEERNDFASWIEASLGMGVLGRRIEKLKDKKKIISAIDKVANSPARMKSRIIEQIKGEILDGAG